MGRVLVEESRVDSTAHRWTPDVPRSPMSSNTRRFTRNGPNGPRRGGTDQSARRRSERLRGRSTRASDDSGGDFVTPSQRRRAVPAPGMARSAHSGQRARPRSAGPHLGGGLSRAEALERLATSRSPERETQAEAALRAEV